MGLLNILIYIYIFINNLVKKNARQQDIGVQDLGFLHSPLPGWRVPGRRCPPRELTETGPKA
jgi:hypothetical protein